MVKTVQENSYLLAPERRLKTAGLKEFLSLLQRNHRPILLACMGRRSNMASQISALNEMDQEYGSRADILIANPADLEKFEQRFRISGTPTFLLFDGRAEIDRLLGMADRDTLHEFLQAVV